MALFNGNEKTIVKTLLGIIVHFIQEENADHR
jgi:hypothetical protein